MSSGSIPDQGDGIDAQALRGKGVAHRGQLMDDLHTTGFQGRHQRLRATTGSFDNLDTLFTQNVAKFKRPLRKAEFRNHGQIHTEWLICQIAQFTNFGSQVLRCFQGLGGNEADPAGFADGCYEFSSAEPLHPATDNRILDSKHFRYFGFEHLLSPFLV